MVMIVLAILATSIAALTGIIAIGSGRHWRFNVSDYFKGKRNAVLYLWVVSSSIFSILHSGSLVQYGVEHKWGIAPADFKWLLIHACTGILLTCAHLFVASTLSKEVGPVDKYLWGKRRAV